MMKRKHEDIHHKALSGDRNDAGKNSKTFQKTSYISDPKLVPRLKRYFEMNKHTKHLDIDTIADDLRKQYGEYARKKRNSFVKSVEKAYDVAGRDLKLSLDKESELEERYLIKKKKSKSSQRQEVDSDDNSFSSDNNDYVTCEDTNIMNSFMSDMYKGTKNQQKMSTPITHKSKSDPAFFIDRGDKMSIGVDAASDSMSESFVNVSLIKSSNKEEVPSGTATPVSVKSSSENKKSSKKIRKQQEDTDKKKGPDIQQSTLTFADVGGNETVLMEICKLLVHMRHPEIYQALGVTPPRGFLLHGPPGCGKTLLAHAIAGELDLPFIKLAATEIISGVSGESEEKIRDLFEKAVTCAPCIVFLDEIDAITPKRETASKDMERRIVSQLLTCMDELNSKTTPHVLIIGATNRPDSIDPALRRAGRFDREISLGIPDEQARVRILKVLCRNLKMSEEFDLRQLARNTPGYVGADLMALTREAAMTAVNRVFESLQSNSGQENFIHGDNKGADCDKQMEVNAKYAVKEQLTSDEIKDETTPHMSSDIISVLSWLKEQPPLNEDQLNDLFIKMEDFEESLKHVQPSAKREGFATIPDVTWDDIGALHLVREELQLSILAPVRHSEEFKSLGLKHAPGILLAGPPGCGKTLLAKAIANESGINFISVKGPELLNMYVGESERAVRQVFQRARNSSPCVIFFDELDALCPKRSNSGEGGASVRVVNQMLTEMDGLEERKQVFIMGASNRPDIIDPAILRPGRLDKLLYVGLPSPADRLDILVTITKNGTKPKLSSNVSLEEISNCEMCSDFTGADLAALVREASVSALKEVIKQTEKHVHPIQVTKSHFDLAFTKVKPSVSRKDLLVYENIKTKMTL